MLVVGARLPRAPWRALSKALPEIRPAPVFFVPPGPAHAAVGAQAHRDLLPE